MSTRTAKQSSIKQEELAAVTKMVIRLFEHWKLTYEQQSMLLGLSTHTHSTIARYKKGVATLSSGRDMQDRAGHLLAIHKILRTIFPLNNELVYTWPSTPNAYFNGRSPIQVIADDGFLGLVNVRHYLENYLAS